MNTTDDNELRLISEFGHLNYLSSLSKSFVHFNPKDLAIAGLTALLTVAAQLKNLRRSQTSQGQLTKIEIAQSS